MYLYYISDLSFATVEFCGKSTFINRNSKEEEEETNTYPHLLLQNNYFVEFKILFKIHLYIKIIKYLSL